MNDLEPGTAYYVVVTAENKFGEGYKAVPALFMTLEQEEPLTLYVWGNNVSSELGISDEQVFENISYYKKSCMLRTLRQKSFQRETVL